MARGSKWGRGCTVRGMEWGLEGKGADNRVREGNVGRGREGGGRGRDNEGLKEPVRLGKRSREGERERLTFKSLSE